MLEPWGRGASERHCIKRPEDVLTWIESTRQPLDAARSVVATFVVDPEGRLWIADRHSEHVRCAAGGDVLSAGEMTFTVRERGRTVVSAVTNQSNGYCPEPESWPAVAAALDRAALPHPSGFTTKFTFRRCPACGATNVVKDGWFECGECGGALPEQWNFGLQQ